eukprot:7999161-Pyramimonas_sp.AAC.1
MRVAGKEDRGQSPKGTRPQTKRAGTEALGKTCRMASEKIGSSSVNTIDVAVGIVVGGGGV